MEIRCQAAVVSVSRQAVSAEGRRDGWALAGVYMYILRVGVMVVGVGVGVGEGEGGRGEGGWGCLIGAGVPVTVALVEGEADVDLYRFPSLQALLVREMCAVLSLMTCGRGVLRAEGPSQGGCRPPMGGAGGGGAWDRKEVVRR